MRCIFLTQSFPKYSVHSSSTSAIQPIYQTSDCFKIHLASGISIPLHSSISQTQQCLIRLQAWPCRKMSQQAQNGTFKTRWSNRFSSLIVNSLVTRSRPASGAPPPIWVWPYSRFLPVRGKCFLPGLFVGGVLGFCEMPRENFDCNRHINKDELN